MAGTRSQNTMVEGLNAMLGQVAQLMAAPDADLDTLSSLQAQLLKILKAPQQAALEKFAAAGGVVPGAGGQTSPGGLPPDQMPVMPPLLAGAGSPENPMMTSSPYRPWGVRGGNNLPPVDELRRLVASTRLA